MQALPHNVSVFSSLTVPALSDCKVSSYGHFSVRIAGTIVLNRNVPPVMKNDIAFNRIWMGWQRGGNITVMHVCSVCCIVSDPNL